MEIPEDFKPRPISDVMTAIENISKQNEAFHQHIHNAFRSIFDSLNYCAPEAIGFWWKVVAETLDGIAYVFEKDEEVKPLVALTCDVFNAKKDYLEYL